MQVELTGGSVLAEDVDVLVIPVFQASLDRQRPLAQVDEAFGGHVLALAEANEFVGKWDERLEIPGLGIVAARTVLFLGFGARKALTLPRLRDAGAAAARLAQARKARTMTLVAPDKADADMLRALAEGIHLGAYRYTRFFTRDRVPTTELATVRLLRESAKATPVERKALEAAAVVARAVCLARDAVNDPPNELTPDSLAARAVSLAEGGRLESQVLDLAGIRAAGMHLHAAVGVGSRNEPRFIHLVHRPKRSKTRLAFVGKGLTFDSGGLCIKPAAGMGDMKSDMGGAAAVLGLMSAVAQREPKVEIHGIIAAAENMPDGAAYRPGDVISSLDGKTVEIVNTDAEGRLVLADALTYAARLEPAAIFDAATLTGACMVALGKTTSGWYSSDEGVSRRVERALKASGESMWRLPLLEELREQLRSDVADLKHTGDRWGGSITAALFLREFVADVPWAHFDIAGPALSDRAAGITPKGGTGHGVLTFLELVETYL